MSYQLSAYDLHCIIKELRETLLDARVDKFFQPKQKEFLISFHVPGKGKHLLKINLPQNMFLTEYKEEMPTTPLHFCMVLRKYLGGSFLRKIEMIEFERIIDFTFDTKDGEKHLIMEFFSKGNMFLTDSEYTIKSLVEPQKWKDRTLRGNVRYEHPSKDYNGLTLTFEELGKVIADSDKESIVKVLALDLGFGGRYAEELCYRAGIDKEYKLLEENDRKKLYAEIEKLREEKLEVARVYKNEDQDEKEPNFITPIKLQTLTTEKLDPVESFSKALDKTISTMVIKKSNEQKLAPFEKEKRKLEKQIKQQEEQIKTMEKNADDFQHKGEILYNNYQTVEPLMAELNDILKKHDHKDIKAKLKDHKVIKDINFKDKTVVLELE